MKVSYWRGFSMREEKLWSREESSLFLLEEERNLCKWKRLRGSELMFIVRSISGCDRGEAAWWYPLELRASEMERNLKRMAWLWQESIESRESTFCCLSEENERENIEEREAMPPLLWEASSAGPPHSVPLLLREERNTDLKMSTVCEAEEALSMKLFCAVKM